MILILHVGVGVGGSTTISASQVSLPVLFQISKRTSVSSVIVTNCEPLLIPTLVYSVFPTQSVESEATLFEVHEIVTGPPS